MHNRTLSAILQITVPFQEAIKRNIIIVQFRDKNIGLSSKK